MTIRKMLMTTAALAVMLPVAVPTMSSAAGLGPRGAANAAAGGSVHIGGGGGGWSHGGGGGGWSHGGGGGGWNHGGGVAMGNGGNWHGGGGGWHGGHGWHGGGWGAGLAAGALVGGALASNAYYGGPYYNNYDYGYYDQPDYFDDGGVVVSAPVGGDSVSYCMQRFRSYDPASGTYLGYDGIRHPCP